MAYYDSLSDKTQTQLYNQLGELISKESDSAYKARVLRATTSTAKKACSGAYQGSWFRLREEWLKNQVSNLHVMDCIRAGRVIGDTEGVRFVQAPRLNASKVKRTHSCM